MLQVMGDKPYIVMSDSAYDSLLDNQIKAIEKNAVRYQKNWKKYSKLKKIT